MDGFRPGFRSSAGGDRKVGIVSGKSFSTNQIYSTTRARSPSQPPIPPRVSRMSQSSSSSSKPWRSFDDPEMKRRKRIAKYKVYTVEGKAKASLRNGLRWIKNKCSQIVHGF